MFAYIHDISITMNYPQGYYDSNYMTQNSLGYRIKDVLHPYFGITGNSVETITPSQLEDSQKEGELTEE
jgi:hypothetical protein